MWVLNCPLDKSYQESLKPLLIKYEVEALWLIGSRSRNDFRDDSDWDFMICFRLWNVKKHTQFEHDLREICGGKSSALTLLHVISVLPPEHSASVIRDAIPVWKV